MHIGQNQQGPCKLYFNILTVSRRITVQREAKEKPVPCEALAKHVAGLILPLLWQVLAHVPRDLGRAGGPYNRFSKRRRLLRYCSYVISSAKPTPSASLTSFCRHHLQLCNSNGSAPKGKGRNVLDSPQERKTTSLGQIPFTRKLSTAKCPCSQHQQNERQHLLLPVQFTMSPFLF